MTVYKGHRKNEGEGAKKISLPFISLTTPFRLSLSYFLPLPFVFISSWFYKRFTPATVVGASKGKINE